MNRNSNVFRRLGLGSPPSNVKTSKLAKHALFYNNSSLRDVQVTRHGKNSDNPSPKESSHTTTTTYDLDRREMTDRIDTLLRSTREMMGPYSDIPRHLIAFSGGVDSSLTAALIHRIHDPRAEHVQAVLGISPAVPSEQIDLAVRVADQLGVNLKQVPTTEGDDETYLANDGRACWACKTHLYSTLRAIVSDSEDTHASSFRLYNGTNADDRKDPTRLGLIAAREFNVFSPLQDLTKDQVRNFARHMGLFNWNYAASPCLRSRLALGVTATKQHLHLMARAERLVRQRLGPELIDETTNLRVRLLPNNHACIEIDAPLVDTVTMSEDWTTVLQNIGDFNNVSVRAFKSGSVAVKDPAEEDDSLITSGVA